MKSSRDLNRVARRRAFSAWFANPFAIRSLQLDSTAVGKNADNGC